MSHKISIEKQIQQAIVLIHTTTQGAGTGFVISKQERLLITCLHVVAQEKNRQNLIYKNPLEQIEFNFPLDYSQNSDIWSEGVHRPQPRYANLITHVPFAYGDLALYQAASNDDLAGEVSELIPFRSIAPLLGFDFCVRGSTPGDGAVSKEVKGKVANTTTSSKYYRCDLIQLSTTGLKEGYSGAPVVVVENGRIGVVGVVGWTEKDRHDDPLAIPAPLIWEHFAKWLNAIEEALPAPANFHIYHRNEREVYGVNINPALFWGINRSPFVGLAVGSLDLRLFVEVEQWLSTAGLVSSVDPNRPVSRIWSGPFKCGEEVPYDLKKSLQLNQVSGVFFNMDNSFMGFGKLFDQLILFQTAGIATITVASTLKKAVAFLDAWIEFQMEGQPAIEFLDSTQKISIPASWEELVADQEQPDSAGDAHLTYRATALRFLEKHTVSFDDDELSSSLQHDKLFNWAKRIYRGSLRNEDLKQVPPEAVEVALLAGREFDLAEFPSSFWEREAWRPVLAHLFWSQHDTKSAILTLKNHWPMEAQWALMGEKRKNRFSDLIDSQSQVRRSWPR